MSSNNTTVNFTYDDLPPSRNHEGLTVEQEWAKIQDAAERRRVQNRNAQRKYRHNLKRRVEALERQHNLGPHFTSQSPTIETSASFTAKTEAQPQPQPTESPTQKQETLNIPKARSVSPQHQSVDLLDPALGSMQSFASTSIDTEWMSHSHFMSAPMSVRSTPLPSPPISHASQSPDVCKKTQMDMENDQSLMSGGMMAMTSLDDYIQHNNSILEDMCSSESISSDDLDFSYHHTHSKRPGLPRRVTAPEPTLGRTTLHLAAMKGYLQIVHMLLEKGIDINTRDSQGWTALHLAAEKGQQEVVKLLLDRGADVYARI